MRASAVAVADNSQALDQAVIAAVDAVLAHGRQALVVTAPFHSPADADREHAFADRLAQKFAGNGRVRYLNLG